MDQLKDIFYKISKLRKDLGRDIHQATEELGEIAKAYRVLKQDKIDTGKKIHHLKEEACDLMICALAIYYGTSPDNFDLDEMYDTIQAKLEKWEQSKKG